jgi:hypothetical protein
MMGIIAYFCGITDATTLTAVVVLVSTTMLFGNIAEERANIRRRHWCACGDIRNTRLARLSPHLMGWIPQLAAWGIIIARFTKADADTDHRMPKFVIAIVGTQGVLFTSFAVVQLVMLWNTMLSEKKAVYCEAAYAVLSAVAKLLLVWMVFANIFLS